MKKKVEVSVITPSHNTSDFIRQMLDSVVLQSFKEWELIIVDDVSTDKSIEIIEEYIDRYKDKKIILIKNSHKLGAAQSRNKAIELAEGRFIAFLDSDDLWELDKLEKQIAFMKTNQIPFSYTFYEKITESNIHLGRVDKIPLQVNYWDTIKSNKIGCLTAIYDTCFFGKVYMENIQKRQDYTLWLKLLRKTEYAFCLPESLAKYRIRRGSISSNKFQLIKYHWLIYKDIEKHSVFCSVYFLSRYIISLYISKLR